ncbi:unnamed protein product [Dibothriocephalus latus]|uniref:V-type proton ATPase subunit a n=1 Tax=Dibothriocephalus latus TaxID=60516 RepID=A0A3P6QHD4_DIBLA|nr:unnamed protein product [Dibothriocephalus latus]
MEKEIRSNNLAVYDCVEIPEAPAPREMIDMETTFDKLANEASEVNSSLENLKKTYFELQEMKHLLRKTQIFFEEVIPLYPCPLRRFSTAGVIHREKLPAFERMLWRACSGNVFLKQAEIELPLEDPLTVRHLFTH